MVKHNVLQVCCKSDLPTMMELDNNEIIQRLTSPAADFIIHSTSKNLHHICNKTHHYYIAPSHDPSALIDIVNRRIQSCEMFLSDADYYSDNDDQIMQCKMELRHLLAIAEQMKSVDPIDDVCYDKGLFS